MNNTAAQIIAGFEGFREKPYWDVNAFRTGYGSDTITRADGSVVPVSQGMSVSQEDAFRDLERRINGEFAPSVVSAIGQDRYSAMTPEQQGVLTSLAYNYGAGAWGKGLAPVANAVRSGADSQSIAQAIAALGSHNDGINAGRRAKEASIFTGGAFDPVQPPVGGGSPQTAADVAPAPEETMKLFGFDTGMTEGKFDELGKSLTPQMQPMQAPQIQRGPGYIKQTDGLARALEAFKSTQAKRRA